MKKPLMTTLAIPMILQQAKSLPQIGKLTLSANHLTYLDIDDAYIHQLFPLLPLGITKPNYFGQDLAGAHISVIYPEESLRVNPHELGKDHSFKIQELVAAQIGPKKYYVLLVSAPTLLALRRHLALPDALAFKGYAIDFHITIGVSF